MGRVALTGRARVRRRLTVWKVLKRTLSATVRPRPCAQLGDGVIGE